MSLFNISSVIFFYVLINTAAGIAISTRLGIAFKSNSTFSISTSTGPSNKSSIRSNIDNDVNQCSGVSINISICDSLKF